MTSDEAYQKGYAAQIGGGGFLDNAYESSTDQGRRWIDGYVKSMQDERATNAKIADAARAYVIAWEDGETALRDLWVTLYNSVMAGVAQPVERDASTVDVASSSLAACSGYETKKPYIVRARTADNMFLGRIDAVNAEAAIEIARTSYGWSHGGLVAVIDEFELLRKLRAYREICDEVGQTAGKALGYPWYKDDQKNFPGATEKNGVCIGEHVTETIVDELARRYGEVQRDMNHHTAEPAVSAADGGRTCPSCGSQRLEAAP